MSAAKFVVQWRWHEKWLWQQCSQVNGNDHIYFKMYSSIILLILPMWSLLHVLFNRRIWNQSDYSSLVNQTNSVLQLTTHISTDFLWDKCCHSTFNKRFNKKVCCTHTFTWHGLLYQTKASAEDLSNQYQALTSFTVYVKIHGTSTLFW